MYQFKVSEKNKIGDLKRLLKFSLHIKLVITCYVPFLNMLKWIFNVNEKGIDWWDRRKLQFFSVCVAKMQVCSFRKRFFKDTWWLNNILFLFSWKYWFKNYNFSKYSLAFGTFTWKSVHHFSMAVCLHELHVNLSRKSLYFN